MRIVIFILLLITLFLQYKLWFAKGGVTNTLSLHREVTAQIKQNEELKKRNEVLKSDIANLKQAGGAIEEHARNDLGMIKKNETFYQIVTTQKNDSDQAEDVGMQKHKKPHGKINKKSET